MEERRIASPSTQLILSWATYGILFAGISFCLYLIWKMVLSPILKTFKKKPAEDKNLKILVKGYKDKESLQEALKESEWSEKSKMEALNLFDNLPPELVKEEPKASLDPNVVWVKKAMEKGYKRKAIKKLLKDKGWSDEAIIPMVKIYNILKAEKKNPVEPIIKLPEL